MFIQILVEFIFLLQTGALRLRGGYRKGEGRLEVFADNIWGTICDDTWSISNADVVCRQLGFGSAIEATHWADQGQGIGKVCNNLYFKKGDFLHALKL